MMRARIKAALRERPQTLDELSTTLGVPRSQLRSALTAEFYGQREIHHPEHGVVTAWFVQPSDIHIDGSSDQYYVAAVAA